MIYLKWSGVTAALTAAAPAAVAKNMDWCGRWRGTACVNASAFITDEEETNDEES